MNIDLIALCQHLGFTRSAYSENQLMTDQHSIKITGEKWFDHDAGKGGGGAIDLVMYLQGIDYKTARDYLGALPPITAKPADKRKTAIEVIESLGLKKGDKSEANVYEGKDHRITVTHDLWKCHKCDTGGKGAINLVMHVDECNYAKAKDFLEDGKTIATIEKTIETNKAKPPTKPTTPPKFDRNTLPAVIDYLCINRGLNRVMVDWCVSKGIIYSDHKANACFRYGQGVAVMGTGAIGFRANYGTLTECFTIPARGQCEAVAIVESAIDALSYRQLNPSVTVCAIAGNANNSLMRYALDLAAKNSVIVVSAFDSDKGGDDGHDRLLKLNNGIVEVYEHRPPTPFKDWNDFILNQ